MQGAAPLALLPKQGLRPCLRVAVLLALIFAQQILVVLIHCATAGALPLQCFIALVLAAQSAANTPLL